VSAFPVDGDLDGRADRGERALDSVPYAPDVGARVEHGERVLARAAAEPQLTGVRRLPAATGVDDGAVEEDELLVPVDVATLAAVERRYCCVEERRSVIGLLLGRGRTDGSRTGSPQPADRWWFSGRSRLEWRTDRDEMGPEPGPGTGPERRFLCYTIYARDTECHSPRMVARRYPMGCRSRRPDRRCSDAPT
jgi:hypothetical protein